MYIGWISIFIGIGAPLAADPPAEVESLAIPHLHTTVTVEDARPPQAVSFTPTTHCALMTLETVVAAQRAQAVVRGRYGRTLDELGWRPPPVDGCPDTIAARMQLTDNGYTVEAVIVAGEGRGRRFTRRLGSATQEHAPLTDDALTQLRAIDGWRGAVR